MTGNLLSDICRSGKGNAQLRENNCKILQVFVTKQNQFTPKLCMHIAYYNNK